MRARVLATVILLASCGSAGPALTTTTTDTAAPPDTTAAGAVTGMTTTTLAGDATWTKCGTIECGVLAGSGVHMYRRAATGESRGTLVLLPDYEGLRARDLAEQATVMVGPAARSFDVIAVSPRGSYDSTPLPCATQDVMSADPAAVAESCRSDQALSPQTMGAVGAVADLQQMVTSLRTGPVNVVGWGRGATIAAVWEMLQPESVMRAVLDSPDDPGVPQPKVAELNRTAEDAAVARVMAWCTEHLSCPFVENAAKRTRFVRKDIRDHRIGVDTAHATDASFRLAFRRVIASGDYGAVFQALAAAEKNDYAPLVDLASVPEWSARIAGQCADMSARDADEIIAADKAFVPTPTLFRVGLGASVAQVCTQMPESPDPLGEIAPASGTEPGVVQVFVGSGDGVTAPGMVKAMAKRVKWKFRAVRANRHLVVGYDRTTTTWVSDFLLG